MVCILERYRGRGNVREAIEVEVGNHSVLVVRPFINTDLPAIVRLWNAHHQGTGQAYPVSPQQFQAAVLDRQMFSPRELWIVESHGEPQGFVHYSADGTGKRRLVALCIEPRAGDDDLAAALLRQVGKDEVREAGLAISHRAGYLGLSTLVGLIGIPDHDVKVFHWLQNAGFKPFEYWSCWQLSLTTFRLPVDRRVLALRRNSNLSEVDASQEPVDWAAGWGHLDPIRFELRERTGKPIGQITAWHSGYGDVISGSEVFLTDLLVMPGAPDGTDLHLVSESLRELSMRRFLSAKAVIREDQPKIKAFWQGLGFQVVGQGATFQSRVAMDDADG